MTCEAEVKNGLDLLGLRLTAQTIGNSLLSGVTTISPTVRYLSIRAWVIRTFELSGLPASYKTLEDYAASIESAVVLGNLLVNPQMSGLVGPDKAHPLVESDADPLPLDRLVSQLAFNTYTGPSEALGLSFVPPNTTAQGHDRNSFSRRACPPRDSRTSQRSNTAGKPAG